MKHKPVVGRRGRKKGSETPLIGRPLVGRTKERLLAGAAGILAKESDLVEWRVDCFDAIAGTAAVPDTARALRSASGTLPFVFTSRSRGGEMFWRH